MKTIVLVDDLDALRGMVRDFLKSTGFEVLEASTADEAVGIAVSYPHKIDLLLTDIEMPGTSGLDMAKQFAMLWPGIPVVCMSAGMSRQEWNNFDGKPVGAYFLEKPFRLRDMEALLRRIFSEITGL